MSTSQNPASGHTGSADTSSALPPTNQDTQSTDKETKRQDGIPTEYPAFGDPHPRNPSNPNESPLNASGRITAGAEQHMENAEQTASIPHQSLGQLGWRQAALLDPPPQASQPSNTGSNMGSRGNLQPPKRRESEAGSSTKEQDAAPPPKRPRQSNPKRGKPAARGGTRKSSSSQARGKNNSTSQTPSSSTTPPFLPPQPQVQNLIQQYNNESVPEQWRDTPHPQVIRRSPPSPPSIPVRARYEDEYTFEILRDNPILEFVMGRSADLINMNLPVSQCLILCKRRLLEYSEHAQLEFVQPRDSDTEYAREQRRGAKLRIREVRGGDWSLHN